MINRLILLAALMLISLTCLAQKQRTYEYKCWVTLSSGDDEIAMLKLDTKGNHSQARTRLASKKSYKSIDGLKEVEQVHECVTLNDSFISIDALELDQATVK